MPLYAVLPLAFFLYTVAAMLVPALGLGGFLLAQAVSALVGSILLMMALMAHYGRSFLRPWMAAVAMLTMVVVPSVLWSVAYNSSPAIVAIIGGTAVAATLATAWATQTTEERKRLVSLLTQLAGRGPNLINVMRRGNDAGLG